MKFRLPRLNLQRVRQTAPPKGAKTEMIEAAIASMTSSFTAADLERACPGVSRDNGEEGAAPVETGGGG